MSHMTKVKVEMYDLDVIEESLKELGIVFEGEGVIRGYMGNNVRGKIVIKQETMKGMYGDMGLVYDDKTKSYAIVGDSDTVRRFPINKFKQTYAHRKLLKVARKQRLRVKKSERTKNGEIKLVLRRM